MGKGGGALGGGGDGGGGSGGGGGGGGRSTPAAEMTVFTPGRRSASSWLKTVPEANASSMVLPEGLPALVTVVDALSSVVVTLLTLPPNDARPAATCKFNETLALGLLVYE